MRTKSLSARKLLSLALTLVMMTAMLLPTGVFATAPTVSGDAVATVKKAATGVDLIKQITVTFDREIAFDETDFTDTNVTVNNGHGLGASTALIDTEDETKLVITLADDATVEVGDKITFANDIIKDKETKLDVFNGDVTVDGKLTGAMVAFNVPVGVTVSVEGGTAPSYYGVGEYSYSAEGTGYVTVNDSFTVTEGDLGTTKNVPISINEVPPKVIKAVAVDNDGTASTVGDEILVYFDKKTNMSATGELSGVLKGASYSWINEQTLKIVLGTTAITASDSIDIGTINIKDASGSVPATGLSDIALEGGFGHAIKPCVARVSAVSVTGAPKASQGDKIVVAFNTLVDYSKVTDISVSGGNLGNGFTVEWKDSETTVAVITIGAGEPKVEVGTTSIRFVGEIWDTAGTIKMSEADHVVAHGAWGVTITPELMSATIVKSSAVPTAQAGDKIVFVFTTSTNSPEDVVASFGSKFGTGATGEWSANGTIYTVTLGQEPTVADSDEINFTNKNDAIKDIFGFKSVADKSGLALKGSFGKANRPELISATIVKNAVKPKAQQGDKIVLVFSAMTNEKADIVSLFGNKFGTGATGEWSANGTVYTITLGTNPTITDEDKITLTENSGFMDVHEIETVKGGTEISLDGTFGKEIVQNLQVSSVIAYSEGSKNKIKVIFNVETNLTSVVNPAFKTALGDANKVSDKCIFGEAFEIDVTAQELVITLDNQGYSITDETVLSLAGLGIKSASGGELTGEIPACEGYFVPVVTNVAVLDDGVTVAVYFSARTDGNTEAAKAAVAAQKALFGADANQNVEWKNNNTELHIKMSDDNTMSDDAYIVLNDFKIYDEFSKTHKVVGQYKVDTEKLDYKTLTFTLYANAINTENAAREDVTKAKDGDELVIEFGRATNTPDNMLENLALENAEDKFGEGATAVWSGDKKLVVTLGEGAVISTSSKIIVKNVKFANGTGKLSQSNADESEAVAVTGKFDGREYWIDNATKSVANGRTRITVSLKKSAIATEATNVFAICQAYNSKNTVETISAIGVPDKAENSFVFDFNATNLTDFEVFVLKGDYSDMTAGVDVYSDKVKPAATE